MRRILSLCFSFSFSFKIEKEDKDKIGRLMVRLLPSSPISTFFWALHNLLTESQKQKIVGPKDKGRNGDRQPPQDKETGCYVSSRNTVLNVDSRLYACFCLRLTFHLWTYLCIFTNKNSKEPKVRRILATVSVSFSSFSIKKEEETRDSVASNLRSNIPFPFLLKIEKRRKKEEGDRKELTAASSLFPFSSQ